MRIWTILLFGVILCFSVSCVKDYTCTCTDSSGDTHDISIQGSKSTASATCESSNTSQQSCTLK